MLIFLFSYIFYDLNASNTGESRSRTPGQPKQQKTDGIIIFKDQIENIRQTHCKGR